MSYWAHNMHSINMSLSLLPHHLLTLSLSFFMGEKRGQQRPCQPHPGDIVKTM